MLEKIKFDFWEVGGGSWRGVGGGSGGAVWGDFSWGGFERYSEQFGCFLEPFGLVLTILAWLGKDPRTSTSWVRLPVHVCTERFVPNGMCCM